MEFLCANARNALNTSSHLRTRSLQYHLHIALLLYEHYNDILHKKKGRNITGTAVRIRLKCKFHDAMATIARTSFRCSSREDFVISRSGFFQGRVSGTSVFSRENVNFSTLIRSRVQISMKRRDKNFTICHSAK